MWWISGDPFGALFASSWTSYWPYSLSLSRSFMGSYSGERFVLLALYTESWKIVRIIKTGAREWHVNHGNPSHDLSFKIWHEWRWRVMSNVINLVYKSNVTGSDETRRWLQVRKEAEISNLHGQNSQMGRVEVGNVVFILNSRSLSHWDNL